MAPRLGKNQLISLRFYAERGQHAVGPAGGGGGVDNPAIWSSDTYFFQAKHHAATQSLLKKGLVERAPDTLPAWVRTEGAGNYRVWSHFHRITEAGREALKGASVTGGES